MDNTMRLDDFEEEMAALQTEIVRLQRELGKQGTWVEALEGKYQQLYQKYISLNNRLSEVPVGAWDESDF